jgi:hypothetical protein
MLWVRYVAYDLQQLRVSVNTPAVLRRTSPFPTETGEPPLAFADLLDALKRDGVSPVVAEVVFIEAASPSLTKYRAIGTSQPARHGLTATRQYFK